MASKESVDHPRAPEGPTSASFLDPRVPPPQTPHEFCTSYSPHPPPPHHVVSGLAATCTTWEDSGIAPHGSSSAQTNKCTHGYLVIQETASIKSALTSVEAIEYLLRNDSKTRRHFKAFTVSGQLSPNLLRSTVVRKVR